MYLQMATGTGKTITAAGVIAKLWSVGLIRRSLFLVDRDALAVQTVKKFKNHLGDNFNIERHLAVRAIRRACRDVLSAVNRDAYHVRLRNAQLLEVHLQIAVRVASTQFDDSDTLAASVVIRWKVVELGKLQRGIGCITGGIARIRRDWVRLRVMALQVRPRLRARHHRP